MTADLHLVTTVEDDAKELLRLRAQKEELDAKIAEVAARLTDAVEVGGRIDIDGRTVFRVSQRAPFDVDTARRVPPADVVAACTETVTEQRVDKKRLEALATGLGMRDACLKPGVPYIQAAK